MQLKNEGVTPQSTVFCQKNTFVPSSWNGWPESEATTSAGGELVFSCLNLLVERSQNCAGKIRYLACVEAACSVELCCTFRDSHPGMLKHAILIDG